ncbi:hypothetical protein VCUG_00659 [Vavraia culicis subsp. floridensis]|uniref:Uncharacterized protein n=1 Tax=Vavraia culicis (isolate floridensis) TaxID=948595 RepID=L2GWU0_VAVCU|nr:uncharacterized protein VCUG_00659 [Vavraia culicis subsp. floridensis]ELA47817.1 hypothetical protein VCUG_00659 [Vavraia culicis subsp. floridensis]
MYDLYTNFPELSSFKPEIEGLSSSVRDIIKKIVLAVNRRANYYHFNYEKVKEENGNLWKKINELKKENIKLISRLEAYKNDNNDDLGVEHISMANVDGAALFGGEKMDDYQRAGNFQSEVHINGESNEKRNSGAIVIDSRDDGDEKNGNEKMEDAFGVNFTNIDENKKDGGSTLRDKRVSVGESNDSIHNKSMENNFLDSHASQDDGSFNTSFFSNPLTIINLQNTIYQLNKENILLKDKNERLSKEISFVLDDGATNRTGRTVDTYVNDYYDVIGLLKNMCRLNDSLKNENVRLEASLIFERKEREKLVSEYKSAISGQLDRLKRENTELRIADERLGSELTSVMDKCKLLERSNEEYFSRCKFMEVENYDLKFKNSIYEGLERKLEDKNFELRTYEYKLKEKEKENERLGEMLKDREDKIHSMLVKKPFRQIFLDYKQIFYQLREVIHGMITRTVEVEALVQKLSKVSKTEIANIRSVADARERMAVTCRDEANESLKKVEQVNEMLHQSNERMRVMTDEIENLKKDEASAINKLNEIQEENADLKNKIDVLLVQKNTFIQNNQGQIVKLLEIERKENEKELQKYKKMVADVDLGKVMDVKTLMKQLEESRGVIDGLEKDKRDINDQFNVEKKRIADYYAQELQKAKTAIDDLSGKQHFYMASFEEIRNFVQSNFNINVCDFGQLKEVILNLSEKCSKLNDELETKERSIDNFKSIIVKLRSVNEKMLKRIKE